MSPTNPKHQFSLRLLSWSDLALEDWNVAKASRPVMRSCEWSSCISNYIRMLHYEPRAKSLRG